MSRMGTLEPSLKHATLTVSYAGSGFARDGVVCVTITLVGVQVCRRQDRKRMGSALRGRRDASSP